MRGIYCTSTVPCAFVSASNDSIKIYSAVKNTCYSNCKRCFCLFVVMILLFSYVVNDVSLGKHFQLTDFLLNNMLFQQIVQHDVAICCQFLPISAIEKRGPPKTHLPPSSSGPHFRVSDQKPPRERLPLQPPVRAIGKPGVSTIVLLLRKQKLL